MAEDLHVVVDGDEQAQLEAIVADPGQPKKCVLRARVVLLSAGRSSIAEIAREVGVSRSTVSRWQRLFIEEGIDGLLGG